MTTQRIYFFFILFLISILFWGCDNKSQNTQLNEANAKISKLTTENINLRDQNNELKRKQELLQINIDELDAWTDKLVDGYGPGLWYMDEFTKPVFLKQIQSGNINDIVNELNLQLKKDGLPLIVLTKTQGNTAYIRIDNADYLTQRMGTQGATSYLYAVTYSLASVKQIDCVSFDFPEGDHAIPGKYCR